MKHNHPLSGKTKTIRITLEKDEQKAIQKFCKENDLTYRQLVLMVFGELNKNKNNGNFIN